MTSTSGVGASPPGRNGSMRLRTSRTEPMTKSAIPAPARIAARAVYGRNWSVATDTAAWVEASTSTSRYSWRSRRAPASARPSSPMKTRSSQRLTPMPGRSQRRRFIALSDDSRGVRATSRSLELAMEDGYRPEVPLPEPRRELLRDHDRAVVAARAAAGDRQPRLSLGDVGGDREIQEVAEEGQEPFRRRLLEDERADRVGQARQRPQLVDVEGVRHEPHVEHEIGLDRDAVLEAEADQLEREAIGVRVGADLAEEPLAELAQGQVRGVEDHVGLGPDGIEQGALGGDRADDPLPARQRMAMARLRETPDENVVTRLQEEDLGLDAAALEGTAHRSERKRRVARAHVEHDRDLREPLGI